jgi:hypothetical protein
MVVVSVSTSPTNALVVVEVEDMEEEDTLEEEDTEEEDVSLNFPLRETPICRTDSLF